MDADMKAFDEEAACRDEMGEIIAISGTALGKYNLDSVESSIEVADKADFYRMVRFCWFWYTIPFLKHKMFCPNKKIVRTSF